MICLPILYYNNDSEPHGHTYGSLFFFLFILSIKTLKTKLCLFVFPRSTSAYIIIILVFFNVGDEYLLIDGLSYAVHYT